MNLPWSGDLLLLPDLALESWLRSRLRAKKFRFCCYKKATTIRYLLRCSKPKPTTFTTLSQYETQCLFAPAEEVRIRPRKTDAEVMA